MSENIGLNLDGLDLSLLNPTAEQRVQAKRESDELAYGPLANSLPADEKMNGQCEKSLRFDEKDCYSNGDYSNDDDYDDNDDYYDSDEYKNSDEYKEKIESDREESARAADEDRYYEARKSIGDAFEGDASAYWESQCQ